MNTLSPKDKAAVAAAFEDERWTVANLLTVLTSQGLPVRESVLRRHRRKHCNCD